MHSVKLLSSITSVRTLTHFHSEMPTEPRLKKTGVVESLLSAAIGADAAASVGEAELARRPNGVLPREGRFGKTIASVGVEEIESVCRSNHCANVR